MSKKIFYRGKKLIVKLPHRVFNGFGYHCYRTRAAVRYVRCHERVSLGCKARGKLVNGEILLSRCHTHQRNPKLQKFYTFQEKLYNNTISAPYQSLRIIYDYLSMIHYEAAIIFTWAKMQPVMANWRCRDRPPRPPIPRDLIQFVNLLYMPEYLYLISYPQGQLSAVTLEDNNGDHLTLFYEPNLITSITTNNLYMDGTFKITPRKPKVYQIFTINALIENNALPICWMLMTKKSAVTYQAGLQYFKDVVAPHINPNVIMTDFETGLKTAIRRVYPETTHAGCFFHYCQALIKRLKKLGIFRTVVTWKYCRILVRKFMALALLPADDIPIGYNWLLINTPADILATLLPFIVYFYNQWIISTPPPLWSVFNLIDRTNNLSETFHRKANIRFGVHPSIWKFTETLTRLQAVTANEIAAIQNGDPITRTYRPPEDVDRDQKIKAAWNVYEAGLIDIPDFLACARNFLTAFINFENVGDENVNRNNNIYDNFMVFLEYEMVL